jgi:hypothetical protein
VRVYMHLLEREWMIPPFPISSHFPFLSFSVLAFISSAAAADRNLPSFIRSFLVLVLRCAVRRRWCWSRRRLQLASQQHGPSSSNFQLSTSFLSPAGAWLALFVRREWRRGGGGEGLIESKSKSPTGGGTYLFSFSRSPFLKIKFNMYWSPASLPASLYILLARLPLVDLPLLVELLGLGSWLAGWLGTWKVDWLGNLVFGDCAWFRKSPFPLLDPSSWSNHTSPSPVFT